MLSTRIPFPIAVTIPANTGTGATLRSLIVAAGNVPDPGKDIWSAKILGLLPDGTQRGALQITSPRAPTGTAIAATDYTTHGRCIPAGVPVDEPSAFDLDSYVRAKDSASTITAIVLIQ
jgi:hypothetical protein